MKPEWCPQWAHDRADFLKRVLPGEPLFQHHIELALVDAHQRGKDESQAEIDRLNKVIARMQQTMSSQAEQWTRSMAEAERRGMEKAADHLGEMAKDTPLGHESVSRGRSAYNWLRYCEEAIRAKAQEATR